MKIMDRRKRALFLALLSLMFLLFVSFGSSQEEDVKTVTYQLGPTVPDWSGFWNTFNKKHAKWTLERNEGTGWITQKGLIINVQHPKQNTAKITLSFDAPVTADYRITLVMTQAARSHIHKEEAFNYTLAYRDYVVLFDWNDLKTISGLNFSHGLTDNKFWFRVKRNNIPASTHVELDPSFIVSESSDDMIAEDNDTTHPPFDNTYAPFDAPNIWAGSNGPGTDWYGSGIRFINVTIPDGATITSATLKLTCGAGKTATTVYTRITGEDADETNTFTTDISDYNSRPRTTAYVDWDITSPWTLDVEYSSPDITTIINEIRNRPNWDRNTIVLFWEDDDDDVSGPNCYRLPWSYDGAPSKAPKLEISYTPSTGYFYTFKGVYSEATGLFDPSGVNVTVYFEGHATDIVEVNGSKTYAWQWQPLYFAFDLTDVREYWLSPGQNATNIYIFEDAATAFYTIQFLDYAGALDEYSYVEARYLINGTSHIVEKKFVDVTKSVAFYLVTGRVYDIYLSDGASYVFGDLLMTTDATVTLTLKGLEFPDHISLGYQYVRVWITRNMTSGTTITINYQDLLEDTTQVFFAVYFMNDTQAWNTTQTSDSFIANWNGANNETDYYGEAIITHGLGAMRSRQMLPGLLSSSNPFSLDVLGNLPFNTAYLIPAFILFCVAGVFSALNTPAGLFATVITAIFFAVLQWLPIHVDVLIFAFSLVIIYAISHARRRVVV